MVYYVIKRNDNKYYKDQQTWGLRFVSDISEAEFYSNESGALETMEWIINNKWRYNIGQEQLKVIKVKIEEI